VRIGIALGTVVLSLASAQRARAYLDGSRFLAPAIEGGAGGRFFTGAPADGYTCSVCHREGQPFALALEGLPAEGWEAGQTYDLRIAFPAEARNVGAMIEIADAEGRGQGTLATVPDAELETADRCRTGEGATTVVLGVIGRQLARTDVCGAARARIRWTAPPMPIAGLRLHATAVLGDGSGDPRGDGSAVLVQPLRARGAPAPEGATLAPRCAVPAGERGTFAAWWAIAAVAMVARACRRRFAGLKVPGLDAIPGRRALGFRDSEFFTRSRVGGWCRRAQGR
jgi:hypothetical protein